MSRIQNPVVPSPESGVTESESQQPEEYTNPKSPPALFFLYFLLLFTWCGALKNQSRKTKKTADDDGDEKEISLESKKKNPKNNKNIYVCLVLLFCCLLQKGLSRAKYCSVKCKASCLCQLMSCQSGSFIDKAAQPQIPLNTHSHTHSESG